MLNKLFTNHRFDVFPYSTCQLATLPCVIMITSYRHTMEFVSDVAVEYMFKSSLRRKQILLNVWIFFAKNKTDT